MIRGKPMTSMIQQKPRKMLKLDLINQKCYNQFQGNSDIDQECNKSQTQTNYHKQNNQHEIKLKDQNKVSIDEEINENQKIFQLISTQHLKFRKVNGLQKSNKQSKNSNDSSKQIKKELLSHPSVKLQEGTEPLAFKKQQGSKGNKQQVSTNKKQIKNSNKQKSKEPQPSSNWKKFLEQSQPSKSKSLNKLHKNGPKNNQAEILKNHSGQQSSKFVALDCQFVKCGQEDNLARMSIVSENGQTLYDSYIKPPMKVTDFVTDITGITYSHIKNAPTWQQEISKVKKILMGKLLVGHTLHKDLQVTKLSNWKGISQKIDIADFSAYKQKGGSKNVSLKRMALSFLNRNIQSGWHSSVQDSVATMDLFKLNKKKILKELKLI